MERILNTTLMATCRNENLNDRASFKIQLRRCYYGNDDSITLQ